MSSQTVFVQKSYGYVAVYAFDTQEQRKAVFDHIVESLDMWGLADEIKAARAVVEKRGHAGAVKKLLSAIGIGSHEQFEYGTGICEVRDLCATPSPQP